MPTKRISLECYCCGSYPHSSLASVARHILKNTDEAHKAYYEWAEKVLAKVEAITTVYDPVDELKKKGYKASYTKKHDLVTLMITPKGKKYADAMPTQSQRIAEAKPTDVEHMLNGCSTDAERLSNGSPMVAEQLPSGVPLVANELSTGEVVK